MKCLKTELYIEYLEEASFLYEQRLGLFDDPEVTWLDIEDFEERFEPFIDGLVIGGSLALEVCKQQAEESDFGELHAAVRVFCRQDRLDLVKDVIGGLNPDDEERIQAVSDALKYELPVSWESEIIRMLSSEENTLNLIAGRVVGFRRLIAGAEVKTALQKNADNLREYLWTLGRLRDQSACTMIFNYQLHEDGGICASAALALLRMSDQQALVHIQNSVFLGSWTFLPLGLGGSRSAIRPLLEIASAGNSSNNCLISLGLLGDISVIEILIQYLSNEEVAESTAMAINIITGAQLSEEVFIPEEIDEDELFEEELEKLKKGESLYFSGEEPGTTIVRISQKPEEWQNWWSENSTQFDQSIRYRNGKPYHPSCLLENLKSEKCPNMVRQLAYEELVIRYNIDYCFETDMLVSEQKQVLAKYAEWIEANSQYFIPGRWYFAGQLLNA